MSLLDPYANTVMNPFARRTATLVVLGEHGITDGQLAETEGAYASFRLRMPPTAGFYVQNTRLSDGSTVRITSNNGLDHVVVDPVAGEPITPLVLAGYIVRPADKNKINGWNRDINDNPIPADAYLPVKKDGLLPRPPKPTLHTALLAGTVNWLGAKDQLLTYKHGGAGRYKLELWDRLFDQFAAFVSGNASSGIYYKGTKIVTEFGVEAAAIYEGRLVYLTRSGATVALFWAPSPINKIETALAKGEFLEQVVPAWTQLNPTGVVDAAQQCSAWHFAPDGSKAACAVVYNSFGIGTWSQKRASLEVLPQAKRYLTLSLNIDDELQAVISDTAFAGQALSMTVGTTAVPTYAHVSAAPPADVYTNGDFVFAGKRLWGVDFGVDGAEIEVTMRRWGSAQVVREVDAQQRPTGGSLQLDHFWGVFAGEDKLIEAWSHIPAYDLTTTYDVNDVSTTVAAQTAAGLAQREFLSIHDLDARNKIVVAERLLVQLPQAIAWTSDPSALEGLVGDCSLSASLQVHKAGALVLDEAIAIPAALQAVAVRMRVGYIDSTEVLVSPELVGTANQQGIRSTFTTPAVAGRYSESWHYQMMDDLGTTTGLPPNHLCNYPNQIVDALLMLRSSYTVFVGVFTLTTVLHSGASVDIANQPYFSYYTDRMVFMQRAIPAIAARKYNPDEYAVADRDSAVNGFYEGYRLMGGATDAVAPKYLAKLLDADGDYDLHAPMVTAVNDEVGTGTVDEASFHLEPARTV